ncbi:hypothetical protein ScPMuIL_011630 [Solemya velum]
MLSRLGFAFVLAGFYATFISIRSHPARPPLPSPKNATELFRLAESRGNHTGYLTLNEVDDIYHVFDENNDGNVTEVEFVHGWVGRGLGTNSSAYKMFENADTDHNSVITMLDISRIFTYFDRNYDGHISLIEFIIVWTSLAL